MKTPHRITQSVCRAGLAAVVSLLLLCGQVSHAQTFGECHEQLLSEPTEKAVKVRLTGVEEWPWNPICLWSTSGVRADGNSYAWKATLIGDGLVDDTYVNATISFRYQINSVTVKSVSQNYFCPYPAEGFTLIVDDSDNDVSEGFPSLSCKGSILLTTNHLVVDVTFTGGAPVLQIQLTGKDEVRLSWASTANALYQVEYRSDLANSSWTPLGQPVAGTGQTVAITDSVAGTSRRFYRLNVLQ